jgi:cellulose synthase/poly-beta-1,6-N-acetylglucosamine synthase-like glycosyltransferase
MASRVSVVMPTHNRAQRLPSVIAPLLGDPACAELIVVVDGSRDGSVELLQQIAAADSRLKPVFVESRGEMGAREAGAQAAREEVVLFVDDDVLAEPGLASGHARRHRDGDRLLVLGYMPVRLSEKRRPKDFATRLYAVEYEGRCRRYESDPASILTALWGGNFSLRRADCLKVGMRNPAYTERYHPDRDFGLRCLQAGLVGVFDRGLRAQHLHQRSLVAFARDARSQGAGRLQLHRSYPELVEPLAPQDFEAGLPRMARWALRAARRPTVHPVAAVSLGAIVLVAGQARAWSVQDAAARLLRRIEQQRGQLIRTSRRLGSAAPRNMSPSGGRSACRSRSSGPAG